MPPIIAPPSVMTLGLRQPARREVAIGPRAFGCAYCGTAMIGLRCQSCGAPAQFQAMPSIEAEDVADCDDPSRPRWRSLRR